MLTHVAMRVVVVRMEGARVTAVRAEAAVEHRVLVATAEIHFLQRLGDSLLNVLH